MTSASVPRPGALQAASALGYLAATGALAYGVWGRYDGVDPTWAFSAPVFVGLVVLHLAVGAIVGRWWVLVLPVVWSLVAAPAGGYDFPVSAAILAQAAFFWLPTLSVGVGLRRLVPVVAHGTPGRAARAWAALGVVALAGVLALVVALLYLS